MCTCRAITLIETIISIKFGAQMFKDTVITNVLIWLLIQVRRFICHTTLCLSPWRIQVKGVGGWGGGGGLLKPVYTFDRIYVGNIILAFVCKKIIHMYIVPYSKSP